MPHKPSTNGSVNGSARASFGATPAQRQRPAGPASTLGERPFGIRVDLTAATLVIGLGSTGGELGHRIMQMVIKENGGTVPPLCQYVLIDSDRNQAAESGWDPSNSCLLNIAGAGTLPQHGAKMVQDNWSHLRGLVGERLDRLMSANCPNRANAPPMQAVEVFLFAPCGGTSGGTISPMITLVHQVTANRRIVQTRVHAVLLGPDMTLHDPGRPMSPEQVQVIPATFAANLVRICGDIVSPTTRTVGTPDGLSFLLEDSQRVFGLHLVDHSNGAHTYARTEELLDQLARTYLLRFFTAAGANHRARLEDLRQLGVTGHPVGGVAASREGDAPLPRPAASEGSCCLRLPIAHLLHQGKIAFVRKILNKLSQGRQGPDLTGLFCKVNLHPQAISLEEWLEGGVDIPSHPQQGAAFLEDILQDEGEWHFRFRDFLEEQTAEARRQLEGRLQRLLQELAASGPESLLQGLNTVRDMLEERLKKLAVDFKPWSAAHQTEAERLLYRLRRQVQPKGLARVRGFLKRQVQGFFGIEEKPPAGSKNRLRQMLAQLFQTRSAALRRWAQEEVYHHLLGTPGNPGHMDRLLSEVHGKQTFFQILASQLGKAPTAKPVFSGDDILLVADLDETLDASRKTTFGSLLFTGLKEAGKTPEKLAELLAAHGLSVRGRKYRPPEWPQLPAKDVLHALRKKVNRYLQSSLEDAAANLHLLHPVFAARLRNLLGAWEERSRPYVECKILPGAAPKRRIFLYCFPAHRAEWRHRLPFALVRGDAAAYGTENPFEAVLLQTYLAVAPSSLKGLDRYIRRLNDLKREDRYPVLLDHQQMPELRRLAMPTTNFSACAELFQAGMAASLIRPLPSANKSVEKFTLANCPAAWRHLFAEVNLEPEPKPDWFLQQMLDDEEFLQFVEVTWNLPEFRHQAKHLRREKNAASVGVALEKLGVVQGDGDTVRTYRMKKLPASGRFPKQMYAAKTGVLKGLTRQEFLAALLQHPDLFNFVSQRVLDAYDRHHLSANNLPPFLRKLAEER